MGKNRQKANLTSNNLITSDITNDRIGINSTSPTATLDVVGIVSATSFYGDGSNLSNLPASGIANVAADTNPQLGGNLDLNNKNVTGHGNMNVSGIITATSFGGSASNMTGLTGASAATYGDASNSAQIVVDSNGRITSISNVTISGGGGGSTALTTLGFLNS